MNQMWFGGPKENPPMLVAGIDPGSACTGYALLLGGEYYGEWEVLDCGVVDQPTGEDIARIYDAWYSVGTKALGRRAMLVRVGVEGQWIPRIDKDVVKDPRRLRRIMGQINATVEVAANRGAWAAVAQARGWIAEVIHPQRWRPVMGKFTREERKRKQLKERAVSRLRAREAQFFKRVRLPRRVPDHLAEAVFIGEYFAKETQRRKKEEIQ